LIERICQRSTLLEPETTPFIEQICSTGTKVDNLRTAITVLLQARALSTIIGVGNPWRTADDAPPTVRAEIALVANPHESFWTDV